MQAFSSQSITQDVQTQVGTRAIRRWRVTVIVAALAMSLVGCADVQLSQYRNDELLETARYALGENYVTVNDITYCYQEFGSGPALVIVPGLGTSVDFWQRNIPELAQHYRVIAVDPPGFGKSDKPDVDYSLYWIVDRLRDFLDHKGVDRAHFIGGSMGGHLALMMARDTPDRVDRIVIMGASGVWREPGPVLQPFFYLLFREGAVTDYLRTRWPHIYPRLFRHPNDMTEQLFTYQMALRANRERYWAEGRASTRALRSILYNPVIDDLYRIEHPVLCVWGRHDPVHPVSDGMKFHTRLPNSRMVIFEDASHEVMIDDAPGFNAVVLDFLSDSDPQGRATLE